MAASLPNVTTQSAYAAATTLQCPGSARVNLQVYNAAIYYQLGRRHGAGTAAEWQPEIFLAVPVSLERRCDAIRVRSAVAGAPAQVSIDAATKADIGDG